MEESAYPTGCFAPSNKKMGLGPAIVLTPRKMRPGAGAQRFSDSFEPRSAGPVVVGQRDRHSGTLVAGHWGKKRRKIGCADGKGQLRAMAARQ